ncbi:MAG: type II toxin-antitoxin system VapC family toxin [Nitrospira sp.]|nr:type II toxin-antitoxin system VapC family toxin [Nitrospira sp.]
MKIVLDASIAVKWFADEIHDDAARRLLAERHELLAPELIYAEVANAFLKRWRRGEMSRESVDNAVVQFARAPLKTAATAGLLAAAWQIAMRHDRSVYDALYVALAASQSCPLVTADRKLFNALKDHAGVVHVLWVEDLP